MQLPLHPWILRAAIAVPLCALHLAAPASLHADDSGLGQVTVETLSGEPVRGKALAGIDGKSVSLTTVGNGTKSIPLTDVIAVRFGTQPDPARAYSTTEVALDLWTGEEIRGDLVGGDGDVVKVRSALLGLVEISIDAIGGVRFLERLSRVAEPPDLTSSEDHDILHLVGGDRLTCTIDAFGESALVVNTKARDGTPFPYAEVTAIRLVKDQVPEVSASAIDMILRDGTRVTGTAPKVAGGRITLESASGFEAGVALGGVVAAHVRSAAFSYVSDLPNPTVEVKPFWDLVAGDPAVLYAPRMNRSFGGRALRCSGRTWLNGVGVYAGTSLTWDLGGEYKELRTQVGIDDGAGPLGGVIFEIHVDGKLRWASPYVRAAAGGDRGKAGPVRAPRVDLKGAQQVTLRVLPGDAESPYPIQDEANWLGTMLLR